MMVLALLVKSSIVLLLALAAAASLRRGSSALRHWILAAGICGALILPLASFVTPAWELPMPEVQAIARTAVAPPGIIPQARPGAAQRGALAATAIPWTDLLLRVWVAGTLILVTFTAAGLLGLRRIARTASEVTSEWAAPVAAVGRELGVTRQVRVFLTPHRLAPMTWGCRAPRILLPEHAASWSPPTTVPPLPKPTPLTTEERLAALEKRVTALEKGA